MRHAGESPWSALQLLFNDTCFNDRDLDDTSIQRMLRRQVADGRDPEVAACRVAANDRPNSMLIGQTGALARAAVPSRPAKHAPQSCNAPARPRTWQNPVCAPGFPVTHVCDSLETVSNIYAGLLHTRLRYFASLQRRQTWTLLFSPLPLSLLAQAPCCKSLTAVH